MAAMMKAISVRAPWWWFILHGGKNIENRDWPTKFRGRVLVHASKWWNDHEVYDAFKNHIHLVPEERQERAGFVSLRTLREAGAAIVGSVEIVDCVTRSDSPWFIGRYGFVLRNPIAFSRPILFKGALGFFNVPDELVREAA